MEPLAAPPRAIKLTAIEVVASPDEHVGPTSAMRGEACKGLTVAFDAPAELRGIGIMAVLDHVLPPLSEIVSCNP